MSFSSQKRILLLTSTFPRWRDDDEPSFIFHLCRELSKDFKIHVLAPHTQGSTVTERMDRVRVHRFRYFVPKLERLAYQGGILAKLKANAALYLLLPLFLLSELFVAMRLMKQFNFDVIHAHWILPHGLIAVMARKLAKQQTPVVCTSHGGDLYGLQGPFMQKLKRITLQQIQQVSAVSCAMGRRLMALGVPAQKLRVVPMGVDLQNRFVPLHCCKEGNTLLFVGRLVEKKGVHYLIQAMPAIVRQHPLVKLQIAGQGPQQWFLEQLTIKLGIQEHVVFLGAVKHRSLPALYQAADVFVFPSVKAEDGDQEGLGLTLVEALGCGCAAVVSDLAAMGDIIGDGYSALVVPQKDVSQMADGIIRLLNDSALRQYLGKKGRKDVLARFDWTDIGEQYRELLHTVTNSCSSINNFQSDGDQFNERAAYPEP